jgi:hypothetical protein
VEPSGERASDQETTATRSLAEGFDLGSTTQFSPKRFARNEDTGGSNFGEAFGVRWRSHRF